MKMGDVVEIVLGITFWVFQKTTLFLTDNRASYSGFFS